MRPDRRYRALVVFLLPFVGCDATAPWSSAPGRALPRQLAIAPASLGFDGEVGLGPPAPQRFTVTGLRDWTSLVPDASWPIASVTREDRASFRVEVEPPEITGVGIFESVIRFRACRSGGCAPIEDGIPVRYVVSPASLTSAPSALELDQLVGGPPPPAREIQLDGPAGAGPWTAAAEQDPLHPTWLEVSPSAGATTPAVVTASVIGTPSSPGPLRGAVVVTRGAKQLSIPVQLSARAPATTVSADPLVFSVRQGEDLVATGLPRIALGTEQDVGVTFTLSVTYDDWTVRPWLAVPTQVMGPASLPVAVATTVPVGRHTATLRVRAAWGTSDVRLPVTLDVAPGLLSTSPEALSFGVRGGTTPADATASVTISTGEPQIAWSASADVAWLAVAPASGTVASGAPAVLTVSVVPAELARLPNGGLAGTVRVSANDALGTTSVHLPVTLELALPTVTAVAPGFDVQGTGHDVLVTGEGLDTATGLLFDDVPAAALRTGSSQIFSTPPALAPGTYRVTASNAMGVSRGAATYRVVSPCAVGPAAFASPGRKARIWFDDATCELWEANLATGAVVRRRASGWAEEALSLTGLKDAAPMPDGDRILTWSEAGVRFVDAALLALSSSQPADPWAGATGDGRVVVWMNGSAWFVWSGAGTCLRLAYDVASPGIVPWGSMACMRAMATGRIATQLAGVTDGVSGPTELELWAQMAYGEWVSLLLGFPADRVAVDRTGATTLVARDGTSAPGESMLLRPGRVDGELPSTIAAAVLTQDGSRAVAFDGVSRTVRVFDLVAPPDATTQQFVELGAAGGFAPAADPGASVVLALSADDRILFVGGDERTAVVPLP